MRGFSTLGRRQQAGAKVLVEEAEQDVSLGPPVYVLDPKKYKRLSLKVGHSRGVAGTGAPIGRAMLEDEDDAPSER